MDTKKPISQEPLKEDLNVIEKIKAKRKMITGAVIAFIVIIAAVLCIAIVQRNASEKADEAIALADTEFTSDSVALALYQDAAKLDHKSGNRAGLMAAIHLYNGGKYAEALEYLKKSSVDSPLIEAGRYALMGDCYVNMQDLDQAIKAYKNAIDASENNPQVVPFILVKEANVYRAQQKYQQEYDCYQEIYQKYPAYTQNLRFDIRKYAERAKASAAAK